MEGGEFSFRGLVENIHNIFLERTCKSNMRKLIETIDASGLNEQLIDQGGMHVDGNSYLAIMAAIIHKRYADRVRVGRANRGLKVKTNTNDEQLGSKMFDVVMGLTYAKNPDPNPNPSALENYRRSAKMAAKIIEGIVVPGAFSNSNGTIVKTSECAMTLARIICDDILDVKTPSFHRLNAEMKQLN